MDRVCPLAAAIRSGLAVSGRRPWSARAWLILAINLASRVVVAEAGEAPTRAAEAAITATRSRDSTAFRFSTRGPSAGNRSSPVRPFGPAISPWPGDSCHTARDPGNLGGPRWAHPEAFLTLRRPWLPQTLSGLCSYGVDRTMVVRVDTLASARILASSDSRSDGVRTRTLRM